MATDCIGKCERNLVLGTTKVLTSDFDWNDRNVFGVVFVEWRTGVIGKVNNNTSREVTRIRAFTFLEVDGFDSAPGSIEEAEIRFNIPSLYLNFCTDTKMNNVGHLVTIKMSFANWTVVNSFNFRNWVVLGMLFM